MPALDIALFKPLYSCPLLEDVRIYTYGHSPAVTDYDIEEMALAWPCLRSLSIFRTPRRYTEKKEFPRPKTTLVCLRTLAGHCPLLEQVQIALDTTSDQDLSLFLPNEALVAPRLRSLDLRQSLCGSADRVLAFITALENFMVEDWMGRTDGKVLGSWNEVGSKLPQGETIWTSTAWDFMGAYSSL